MPARDGQTNTHRHDRLITPPDHRGRQRGYRRLDGASRAERRTLCLLSRAHLLVVRAPVLRSTTTSPGDVHSRPICRDALLDRAEVPAQISATVPAFGGSYRSDDLCATAACEPRPYRALGACDRPTQSQPFTIAGFGCVSRSRGRSRRTSTHGSTDAYSWRTGDHRPGSGRRAGLAHRVLPLAATTRTGIDETATVGPTTSGRLTSMGNPGPGSGGRGRA